MRASRASTLTVCIALAVASPAAAQDGLSIRPFVMASGQQFSAQRTFDAVFGQSFQPFWGGGGEVVLPDRIFIDIAAARFEKTGQRAFRSATGETFRLGIPLKAKITALEVSGGYRFAVRRYPKLVPYVAFGVGSYSYKETSDFSAAGEDVDTKHVGELVFGGLEFRVHRWVGLSFDGQFTHIPGILGTGGISKDVGESDLGGTAARIRVLVGR